MVLDLTFLLRRSIWVSRMTKGGQWGLELMGDVGGEVAGSGALLGVKLPLTVQGLLGVRDGILQSGKIILFKGNIQHGAILGEMILHPLRKCSNSPFPPPVPEQKNKAQRGKGDQSTH